MKCNMGKIDRTIRIVLAVVIGILYFTQVITGTLGIVLMLLGGIFILTSILGWCPLYLPFGLKTTKKE